MEFNNFSKGFNFNPVRYEEMLSTFGKKVFKELLKQWNRDQIRNDSTPRHRSVSTPIQNSKVLMFNSYEPPIVINPPTEEINFPISVRNPSGSLVSCNRTLTEHPTYVPSSNELIQTVNTPRDNHVNITAHDLLRTANDTNDNYISHNTATCNINNDEGKETIIDWNNMFDTELFSDTDINLKSIDKQNTSNVQSDVVNDSDCAYDDAKEISFKIPNLPQPKEKQSESKKKRKTQSKITDVITKKVKKQPKDIKNTLRKQTYTKTVKNWLDDVDPRNPVEEESLNNNTQMDKNINKYNVIVKTTKAIKKVVQSQLANKDGIMKYSKPKDLTYASKVETDTATVVKEKKTKAKFIAPIKSQIPVRDVHYEIINLDNDNGNELINNAKDREVTVVLVYSNGFSQLNKQHTEDTCEPEGLMINIDETYYYCKGMNTTEVLTQILERNTIVCFNGKHILMYLKSQYDIDTHQLNIIDAQIGGCILEPDSNIETFAELQKVLCYTPEDTVSTECHLQKAAWYINTLRECCTKLILLLKENDLWSVFVNIEMKVVPIIADMEREGVRVDVTKLKSMEDKLLGKMKEVEQLCYKAAGKTFQLNSTLQVRTIIYDELGLDTKCNVKIRETIGRGDKSTSEAMLRSLIFVHPLPKLILEYRHLHKAHATFLAGIAQHVRDGVVKPTWVQTAAVTGRIASTNPNLQAIPKAPFRLSSFPEGDDEGGEAERVWFRSVYTGEGGGAVLRADFRQLECRVWAQLAHDAALQQALRRHADLFRQLAARWLQKPEDEVSSEERDRTKRMVYATLYGAGRRKIMDILDLGYERTLEAIASFNRTFPSLKIFGEEVVERCGAAGGWLTTAGGRRRAFPQLRSPQPALRAQARRQAVNFVVQGSAADVCKLAMMGAARALRRAGLRARMALQIHDELVFYVPRPHLHAAAGIIKSAMESCGEEYGLRVKLSVSISTGDNWGQLTEYCPDSA